MFDPERDVEQHPARRDAPRPASRSLDVEPHLLITRTRKSLLLGMFSDRAADLGDPVRPSRMAVDLVKEPHREPRREEPHASTVPEETSRLRHGFVSKPCPSNRLLLAPFRANPQHPCGFEPTK